MNVNIITNELLCSGCGSCSAVCNKEAITMIKTQNLGLLRAVVDENKCVDCGLCLKVCPSNNILNEAKSATKDKIIGDVKHSYIGRSLDSVTYMNSQSGGLATTVLKYLFDTNMIDAAVVCVMSEGNIIPKCNYQIVTDPGTLYKTQKSCYTQVDIVSALKYTESYKSVALVGLPCHILGVNNIIACRKYNNIKYKIGLICDKTYMETYMNALVSGTKSKNNIMIDFRRKGVDGYTYKNAPTVIRTSNKVISVIPNEKRMFLKDLFVVPRCNICYDKLNINADIVLGDPWGIDGEYDESFGDSLILTRSRLGDKLIYDMLAEKTISLKEVDLNKAIKGQHIDRRLNSIENINWEQIKNKWLQKETVPKLENLYQTERAFRKYKRKQSIIEIYSKIKYFLSK